MFSSRVPADLEPNRLTRAVRRARAAGTALLDLTLTKQASMLAYNDSWLLILLCFLCVAPAVLVLRKPSPMTAAVDAH